MGGEGTLSGSTREIKEEERRVTAAVKIALLDKKATGSLEGNGHPQLQT